MSVEVAEDMVDVFGGCCVPIPLFDVVCQKCFAGECFGGFVDAFEVPVEIFCELVVEVFTQEMCCKKLA